MMFNHYITKMILYLTLILMVLCCKPPAKKLSKIDKKGEELCQSVIKENSNYRCQYSTQERIDYEMLYEEFCLVVVNMKEEVFTIVGNHKVIFSFSKEEDLYELINEKLPSICKEKFDNEFVDMIRLDVFSTENQMPSKVIFFNHDADKILGQILIKP